MRHIEVLYYGEPPCNGRIVSVKLQAERRTLPIVNMGATQPEQEWRCEACGKRWPHEPRPEEAL